MNNGQLKEIVARYKDQLKEPARTLLDILGFEGLYGLSELYGGSSLYIPKQAYLFAGCMKQSLMDEYDGSNHLGLSSKYNCCTRTVYNLAERRVKRGRA